MKRRLIDLVRCPECAACLRLQVMRERLEDVPTEIQTPACRNWCAFEETRLNSATAGSHPCGVCYSREIDEGVLRCGQCLAIYPIIDGIPRIVRNASSEYATFFRTHASAIEQCGPAHQIPPAHVARGTFHKRSNDSFSFQWQVYQYTDATWFKDDVELRRREFLHSMDLDASQLAGSLVLDAGCGNGRLTASVGTYGAEIVGMDLSRSVERAHAHRRAAAGVRAPFVHFLQGNVMEPPFAPGAFDYVHTSGVLHHTPDTRKAFFSVQRLARPGGRVYVQLYRERPTWVGVPNKIIRAITSRLPVVLLFRLCYLAAPLHSALVLAVSFCRGEHSPIRNASRRERAVSMFDNYSPRYQFRYRPQQVASMFAAAGLRNVKDVTLSNEARHMVAFVGDK